MILSIIYFILILGLIVLVHEVGHFFFAKLFGVYVYEFAIGMGPKIFSRKSKKSETVYSIRLVPIGGFVQLAGEGAEEDKKLPKDRLLQAKKPWQRFLILFFGAGNNLILALLVLFFLGLICGSPTNSPIIQKVIDGSPVYSSGMLAGDKIISVDGNTTKTLDDLQLYLTIAKDETDIVVLRDNKEVSLKVNPLNEEESKIVGYTYGVEFDQTKKTGFFNAIKYAFSKTGSLMRQIVITFKELFVGKVSVKELSGPVGIYSAVDKTRQTGTVNIFYLLALLSINVGFLNLIPFPAFDGGRILFVLIEKIKGSPVKMETENLIHSIGFFILIGLIIFVSFNDILRLFS